MGYSPDKWDDAKRAQAEAAIKVAPNDAELRAAIDSYDAAKGPKTGFIGSGRGNQTEGIGGMDLGEVGRAPSPEDIQKGSMRFPAGAASGRLLPATEYEHEFHPSPTGSVLEDFKRSLPGEIGGGTKMFAEPSLLDFRKTGGKGGVNSPEFEDWKAQKWADELAAAKKENRPIVRASRAGGMLNNAYSLAADVPETVGTAMLGAANATAFGAPRIAAAALERAGLTEPGALDRIGAVEEEHPIANVAGNIVGMGTGAASAIGKGIGKIITGTGLKALARDVATGTAVKAGENLGQNMAEVISPTKSRTASQILEGVGEGAGTTGALFGGLGAIGRFAAGKQATLRDPSVHGSTLSNAVLDLDLANEATSGPMSGINPKFWEGRVARFTPQMEKNTADALATGGQRRVEGIALDRAEKPLTEQFTRDANETAAGVKGLISQYLGYRGRMAYLPPENTSRALEDVISSHSHAGSGKEIAWTPLAEFKKAYSQMHEFEPPTKTPEPLRRGQKYLTVEEAQKLLPNNHPLQRWAPPPDGSNPVEPKGIDYGNVGAADVQTAVGGKTPSPAEPSTALATRGQTGIVVAPAPRPRAQSPWLVKATIIPQNAGEHRIMMAGITREAKSNLPGKLPDEAYARIDAAARADRANYPGDWEERHQAIQQALDELEGKARVLGLPPGQNWENAGGSAISKRDISAAMRSKVAGYSSKGNEREAHMALLDDMARRYDEARAGLPGHRSIAQALKEVAGHREAPVLAAAGDVVKFSETGKAKGLRVRLDPIAGAVKRLAPKSVGLAAHMDPLSVVGTIGNSIKGAAKSVRNATVGDPRQKAIDDERRQQDLLKALKESRVGE